MMFCAIFLKWQRNLYYLYGKENVNMEKYEALEMEVIRFESEDVICASWPTK